MSSTQYSYRDGPPTAYAFTEHFPSLRESWPLPPGTSRIPCGSCNYVLPYTLGTPWPDICPLLEDHYFECPGNMRNVLDNVSHRKSQRAERRRGRIQSIQTLRRPAPKPEKPEPLLPAEPSTPQRPRKKNMMDVNARKKMLEEDEWTTDVTPTSVRCKGCGHIRKLDKRSDYYPGLWIKHRKKCKKIQEKIQASRENDQASGSDTVALGEESENEESDMDEDEDEYGRRGSSPSTSPLFVADKLPEGAREKQRETPSSTSGSLSVFRYDARSSSGIAGGSGVRAVRDLEEEELTDDEWEEDEEGSSFWQDSNSSSLSFDARYELFCAAWARIKAGSDREVEENGSGGYWAHAPFTSGIAGRSDQSEEIPRAGGSLYRCSTYWELATNFQDASKMMRQLLH